MMNGIPFLVIAVLAVVLTQTSGESNDDLFPNPNYDCSKRPTLPPKILTHSAQHLQSFQPFKFRTRKYGESEYSIEADFQGHSILNIKLSNGAKPDSVTSGDLDTFYSFYRSFLVTDAKSLHQIDNQRFVLEMWTVYSLKNDTLVPRSLTRFYPPFISINVLFQVGNSSSRFNPILSGLRKLTWPRSSHPLPYNYDPYALIPDNSSLAFYSTNAFPFPYPEAPLLNPIKRSQFERSLACESVRVYVYTSPLSISEEQLEAILVAQSLTAQKTKEPLGDLNGNNLNIEQGEHYELQERGLEPDIFLTPEQASPILLQRPVSKDAGYILEFRKNSHGEAELDTYAPECMYLENIEDVMRGKMESTGGASEGGGLSFVLILGTIVGSIMITRLKQEFSSD